MTAPRRPIRLPNPARRRLLLVGLVPLFFIALPGTLSFAAHWLWMNEAGSGTVLAREVTGRSALFAITGLAVWALLAGNLLAMARRQRPRPVLVGDLQILTTGGLPEGTRRMLHLAAAALALLVAGSAAAGWLGAYRFMHAQPFGATDPLFGRDVGFYIFTLPVISGLLTVVTVAVTLSIILVSVGYLASGAAVIKPGAGPNNLPRVSLSDEAAAHVGLLVAVLFAIGALRGWFVALPSLVFSTTGPLVGASYADAHGRLPGIHIAAVAGLFAAAAIVVGIRRGRVLHYAQRAFLGYLVVSALVQRAYPAILQRLVVAPTELTRERPYLARHIGATRAAWGLDRVTIGDLRGEATLTLDNVRANAATVENVRLWDRAPLLQTFGQLQEIRTYYDFVDVDDDRYMIDGRYRQVLLAPRELNAASLPTRSFINEHLTFTHGMGLTLAPVNQVTGEGLPVLFIKDLPPVSTTGLTVRRPQIYYGALTNTYAIVRTKQREFDSPSGEDNIFTEYAGRGGVPMSSFARRALFAWHFRSLKILLSGDITGASRILYGRNVEERARQAFPFLDFDVDPYMVVEADGALVWMLDAYTSSANYPYAQRVRNGTNYMRNSVKVTVDAYHGTLRAYVSDPADPLVRTWERVFPGLLQPMSAMPAGLRAHVRYPEDLFRAQAALYAIYHMTDPENFYHREDQWQIPVIGTGDAQSDFMRRIIMRLPGEGREEFIFMSPFTPRGKDNLASWMVARNDGEHYGKLNVYRFPKQSLVFGPQQIVNRMNQDTEIARQVSLWDQRGSEVIRGALMVIPIEESLIYVQPLYLRAEGEKIPELKRVIVAYQNRVVMEETLEAGLSRLFGGNAGVAPIVAATPGAPAPAAGAAAPATSADPLITRAREHYDRAMTAQKAGDWATYGAEIERLGEVLRQLGRSGPP